MDFKNKMECNLEVFWEINNELDCQVITSAKDDSLTGCVETINSPRNKMEAELEMIAPKIIRNEYIAKQDTFVTNFRPTLNYGTNSLLKIGNENGYIYESLIQFDISDIPTNFYITKAVLQLHADNNIGFEGLEICYPDKLWEEHNVVWNGKPSTKKIWRTINLEDKKSEYEIDVIDFIGKWWNKFEKNLGILLKSDNEYENKMINFTSNDSSIKPKLIIEYYDKDLFIEKESVMRSSIKVQTEEKNDISCNIETYFHHGDSGVVGTAVSKNNLVIEGEFKASTFESMYANVLPHPLNKNLNGEIFSSQELLKASIKVNPIEQIESKIKSQITVENRLDGEIEINRPDINIYGNIKSILSNGMIGNIEVNRPDININSKLIISNFDDNFKGMISNAVTNDVNGNVEVNAFKRSDLDTILNATGLKELNSNIYVVYKSNIDGLLKVRKFQEETGIIDINRPKENIKGNIKVVKNSNINGIFDVNRPKENIVGSLKVDQYNNVQGNIYIILKNELKSEINTILKNQIDGIIRPTIIVDSDLKGFIKTIQKSQLNGIIRTNNNIINGEIQNSAISNEYGLIKTNTLNEIFAQIKPQIASDLNGKLKVKAFDIDEIDGIITVKNDLSDEVSIYAFIM